MPLSRPASQLRARRTHLILLPQCAAALERPKSGGMHQQRWQWYAPTAMAVVTATAVATAAAAAVAAVAVAVATATATAVAAGAAAAAVAAAAAAVAKARANLYSHPVSSLSFCTPTLTIALLLHPCLKLVHNCRGPATPGPPILTVD